MPRIRLLAAACAALAIAPPAAAASAGPPDTVALQNGELLITGTAGHDNISIFTEGEYEEGGAWFRMIDIGHGRIDLTDRSSCAGKPREDCDAKTDVCWEMGLDEVNCDKGPVRRLHIVFGAGHDNHENLEAGKLPVTLDGGPGVDELDGEGGDDTILGGPGNDVLSDHTGQDGFDVRDRDLLDGGPGNDELFGTGGPDTLLGGPGNDTLYPFGGRGGRVDAGPGRDTVWAYNHHRQVIDCGPGRDRVIADRGDRLRHCERVTRKRR